MIKSAIYAVMAFAVQISVYASSNPDPYPCQGEACKAAHRIKDNRKEVTKKGCEISLSKPDDDSLCQLHRTLVVTENRKYYKLTTRNGTKTIEFPWGDKIPFLNQTLNAVKGYTINDRVDSKWIKSFGAVVEHARMAAAKHMTKNRTLDKIDDYKQLYREHVSNIQGMDALKYVSNPATDKTFTPFLDNSFWLSDDLFVQQRLAGPCPFLLKLVTTGNSSVGMDWEKLKPMLNQDYNFDDAINRALGTNGMTLVEAVLNKHVYVLYEEDSNDMKTKARDFFFHVTGKTLKKVTSPITLLSTTSSGELKVIAIQIDYRNDSEVFSPASDEKSWSMAKSMVNLVEQNYCQSVWHLSHVHFSSSVYCNIFRSHFSDLHPLHHIMQYHCEGTTPHIALSWQVIAPEGPIDQFSSIGYEGVVGLTLKAKSKYHYGLLAYDQILKSRGLNSKGIKYHPFRDDGELLWSSFKSFAKDFVGLFYTSDEEVTKDEELQSFANEISASGTKGVYGGRGGVIGFPSSFQTKQAVEVFVTRFIWLVAMHAAVNYPMEPWYTFAPLSPSKLYIQNHKEADYNVAHDLPDAPTTVGYITYLTTLGNFRINRIMDHVEKMRQDDLQTLISHHHDHLHTTIQRKLELRNAERKANGKMGFQYFEPKWLTNSIHI